MKKYLLPLILTLVLIFGVNCFATAWEVDTATYADKYKDVGAQETETTGVTFSSDGSKMYIVGNITDTVYQYTVSTPWDVGTATYAEKSKLVSAQETDPRGVTFSSDGSKMYIVGYQNDTVYQYTLSTEWDVSTANYATKFKDISDQDTTPTGVTFSPDGSKMYIIGLSNDAVYQYTVETPWDVSTATYAYKAKIVGAQDLSPHGVAFSSDGSKMYVAGAATSTIYQYTLSTGWDLSTAEYADKSKDTSAQETYLQGVTFSPDGAKMYVVGPATDTVYQYTLPVVAKINVIFFSTPY